MFGGTVHRIAKLAVIAAIALLIGSQLMSTAFSVALSYRLGNILPLSGVLVMSFLFAWLSGRNYNWKAADIIVNVLAGTVLVVSSLSVLFVLLSNGLLVSVLGCAVYVGIVMFVRTPSLQERVSDSRIAVRLEHSGWIPGAGDRISIDQKMTEKLNISVFILPHNSISKIHSLVKERPRLPITITRFLDADILFVTGTDPKEMTRIKAILKSIDIQHLRKVDGLFSKYLLGLPLLAYQDTSCEYVLVKETSFIEKVLTDESIIVSLFPSTPMPVIVMKKNDALGIDSIEIPRGRLLDVLLRRNVENLLPSDEVIATAI